MIIYHKALSCKHSDPFWTTLIFFWKKKITKEKYWKQHFRDYRFQNFWEHSLRAPSEFDRRSCQPKTNLWQTLVGNVRINGLGLTQTKRKNIYRKCFFNQAVSCCVFVLPHALSKYYLMKKKQVDHCIFQRAFREKGDLRFVKLFFKNVFFLVTKKNEYIR